jgi:hypothetical protein
MSSVPSLPTTPARFRTAEIDRLLSALKIIICERAGELLNGHNKNAGYWRLLPHRYPANACFDVELMERTLNLWSRLCKVRDQAGKTHRFSLDATEVWILTLAIRMAKHQDVCHSKKTTTRPTSKKKKWSSLLKKLDRLQRSARSVWLHSALGGLYKSYRARWEKHQLWVRLSYGCLCQQPAIVPSRRRLYVKRGVEVAKEALAEAEIQAPDEKHLHHLVRLVFREIRRGRHSCSIIEILRGRERALGFLSYFIREHLRKSGQLQFIQTD